MRQDSCSRKLRHRRQSVSEQLRLPQDAVNESDPHSKSNTFSTELLKPGLRFNRSSVRKGVTRIFRLSLNHKTSENPAFAQNSYTERKPHRYTPLQSNLSKISLHSLYSSL